MDALTIVIIIFAGIMIWVFRAPLGVMLALSFAGLIAAAGAGIYLLGCACVAVKNFVKNHGRKQ